MIVMVSSPQAFQKTGFDIPSQVTLPGKQVFSTNILPSKFESMNYGYSKPMYSDLYNPAPQSFSVDGSVAMYPVHDTLIPQLPASSGYKQELAEREDTGVLQKNAGATGSELENLLGGNDLGALLNMFMPTNKEKEEPSPDFGIPSDISSILDPFPDQSGLELNNSPLAAADTQTGIDLWTGPKKEEAPLEQPETALSAQDPFMAGLYTEDNARFSPDSDRLYNSAPSLNDIFSEANRGETPSPTNSALQSPQFYSASSDAWDRQLQELFEKATFDFSDGDFMLPPPPKRLHDDSPPYSSSPSDPAPLYPQHLENVWSIDPTPPSSRSRTPSPLPPTSLSPPQTPAASPAPKPAASPAEAPDRTSERGGERKNGVLLFGKHEDEIIHKLLVPRPGVKGKPLTRDKLVSMPVEEFNHLLDLTRLSEIEVAFMKEWRRRGKNKTAAQVARKRKRDELVELDEEVEGLRQQKVGLQSKFDRIRSEIAALKERTMAAEDRVYLRYSKQHESAVSRDTHAIHVTKGGKVVLVPRISSQILLVK